MKKLTYILLALALAGCATQSAIPMGNNLMQIDVSAAPVYGRAGAQKLAFEQAAKATIEAGYDKFVVVGGDNWSEKTASGGSYGSFNVNPYGGSGSGGSFFGSHRHPEVKMVIRMYHYKDKGAADAVDARKVLLKKDAGSTAGSKRPE